MYKGETYAISGDFAPIKGGKSLMYKWVIKPPFAISTLCTSYAIGYMLVIPSGFITSAGSYSDSL